MHLEATDRWFLVAGGVLVVFGAWDDWADLDYRIKLVGQLLAVGIVVVLGDVQIHSITLDDSITLPGWISVPLSLLFLVGITNAINLADGLDGLAGARPSWVCAPSRSCRASAIRGPRRCSPWLLPAPCSASCASTRIRPAYSWVMPAASCSALPSAC
jgi:hypothetical protein